MTGDELRAFRKARGWTQKQLGELISEGLGKGWKRPNIQVGEMERGKQGIAGDVEIFLAALELEGGDGAIRMDETGPFGFPPSGVDTPPPAPPGAEQVAQSIAAVAGGGSYARICEELWELVATGVGMVGAVTGSEKLQADGKIILADKQALGKAYGKLAEQNETFRNMLVGMSGGGAWLEVALVSGITAGKVMRNHQRVEALPAPAQSAPQSEREPEGRMYGDGAVIDLPV